MFSSGFAEALASPAPSTINNHHSNALADNISISVLDETEYEQQNVSPLPPPSISPSILSN